MADDGITVALEDRSIGGLLPRARPPPLGHDDFPELENIVPVEGVAREHHLEAVEFGRVVRPGNLQAGVGAQGRYRIVEGRGGEHADIDRGTSRLGNAGPDSTRKGVARGPVVPPDSNDRRVAQPLMRHTGKGAAQSPGELGGELPVDQAADVVLSEDGFRNVHTT
jgi:hypothetical protein